MQRGAKTISRSLRPMIDNIKSNIRCAVRPFDGDGYAFNTAVKELRAEGMVITYNSERCHYVKG
jgi:hypothetical protein